MTKKNIITKHNVPYILLAPTIIIFAVFMVYPVFRSLYLSFYEYRGGTYEFIHWENYIKLFQDGIFFKSLFNTFVYLLIQVPVMVVGALLIAVLIEQKFIRAKAFFRGAIFLPSVTALVAYALVFKVLMNSDYGLINYVLKGVGFPSG